MHLKRSCAALDRRRNGCPVPRKEGAQWCERHNQERVALYLSYKSDHKALKAFPEESICNDLSKIRVASLQDIKKWNEAIRSKYKLLNRCIDARTTFSERFFGNDMDFGHKFFHERLIAKREELDVLLAIVEQRAYELTLAAQNALWALDQEDPSDSSCPESSTHKTTVSSRPHLQDAEPCVDSKPDEDLLDSIYNAKVSQLLKRILMSMYRCVAPTTSPWHEERLEIIWTFIRRIVFQEKSLMLLAQGFDSVPAFLKSDVLDVAALEKLCKAMEANEGFIQRCVLDVLNTDTTRKKVYLLGGYVYKTQGGDLQQPWRAWYHLVSLGACCTCAVRMTCKTIDHIINLDRLYAIFQLYMQCDGQIFSPFTSLQHESTILRLLGVTPRFIPTTDPRKLKQKYHHVRRCGSWEEFEEYNHAILGLSLSDPKAENFVKKCLGNSEFSVMWRKGPDGPIHEPSGGLIQKRFRIASSERGLQIAKWSRNKLGTSVLQESYYYLDHGGTEELKDCYQVAICDKTHRSLRDFLQCLVQMAREVYTPTVSSNPSELLIAVTKSHPDFSKLLDPDGTKISFRLKDEKEASEAPLLLS